VNTIIRDVYTDKARYNPGENAHIYVELFNANLIAASGRAQVKIRRLFTYVASFSANVNLNSGQGTTLTFDWLAWNDDFRG